MALILPYDERIIFFYPCSGRDFGEPLELFLGVVTDFWFVDTAYFRPGHQDSRHTGMDKSADEIPELLNRSQGWQLIKREVDGPPTWPLRRPFDEEAEYRLRRQVDPPDERWILLEDPGRLVPLAPCTLTETYRAAKSSRVVRIHRRRDHGMRFLLNHLPRMHVFFYRGDSMGEGGSGVRWTDPHHNLIKEVDSRLVPGGLLIADRSNGGDRLGIEPRGDIADYRMVTTITQRRGPTRVLRKSADPDLPT